MSRIWHADDRVAAHPQDAAEPRGAATFDAYLAAVAASRAAHPQWRDGQAHMNTLAMLRSDIAARMWGNGLDPFHDDRRVPEFLAYVREVMGAT